MYLFLCALTLETLTYFSESREKKKWKPYEPTNILVSMMKSLSFPWEAPKQPLGTDRSAESESANHACPWIFGVIKVTKITRPKKFKKERQSSIDCTTPLQCGSTTPTSFLDSLPKILQAAGGGAVPCNGGCSCWGQLDTDTQVFTCSKKVHLALLCVFVSPVSSQLTWE